ncbi:SepA family multidrug efflux transporter [Staphylococcus sp. SQ8-PEA]|uniref:Multidrug resistance efflux pump SepA n=1 Tax=Staphylococcus marylandisciuri TaxID=2981529 RepID=A0ABT2QMA5_9STAP|nr:SepA family multidrug efflux transporter [Staphylococcus marylandisciuri]MCU5745102.1 SepA family multidrug efflux transporter [Staphylococcus marylandisciuri]
MKYIKYLFSTLIMLSIFVISGGIFLAFLGLGMYGLSRILIYLHLAEFTYNKSFYDNSFYYGSYIVLGYFTLFVVEQLMDYFRKKAPDSEYLRGSTFHLISFSLTTIMFYFVIHVHYQYIHIDFWVVLVIIGFLYICKEIFYPDSENLNRRK